MEKEISQAVIRRMPRYYRYSVRGKNQKLQRE